MISVESLMKDYKNSKELWRMLQSLDIITLNHSVRVCEICRVVEKSLGFDNMDLSEAGLFHDIGKYFVSTKLLNKRGKLTNVERTLINLHSYLSYKVLMINKKNEVICKSALFHHSFEPEMMGDGNIFYDDKIKRISIILKTIDIYEALTTDRPYHRGIDVEEALSIVMQGEYDEETIEIIRENHLLFE